MTVTFIPEKASLSIKISLGCFYALCALSLLIHLINLLHSLYKSRGKGPDGQHRPKSPLDAFTLFIAFSCLLWFLLTGWWISFGFWIEPELKLHEETVEMSRILVFVASMLAQLAFFGFALSVYKRYFRAKKSPVIISPLTHIHLWIVMSNNL